ncbi:NAD(P)-dependent oxidoreductase [Oricola nitratireducens]|uniref:NAD(P)-dependent oxidoreductase n=1 Tax=Oricola nitratireducens TaxID=2775868 RepID=UPI0018684F1F|nr:NAD(P)-dependent oxidoreductase [Oricola nitratireducens]
MRIGFTGLGRMGAPMATNIAAAGFPLTVWNRNRTRAEAFAEDTAAAVADTPRLLAEASDVVVTMLADDAASQEVYCGAEGLFSGKAGATTFIEMGTMSPDHIEDLARAAGQNRRVIDAPVSGSTGAAQNAALMIMAGCDETVALPVMPLFEAVGRKTICLGRRGAGAVMKLAVNSIIHGLNQTFAEALTLAEGAGIDAAAAFDAIEASAAAAPMLSYRRPLYLDEAAHDVTFTVALARKDMALAVGLAERFGVAMPQARLNLERLLDAETKGFGGRDMASIVSYMRKEKP